MLPVYRYRTPGFAVALCCLFLIQAGGWFLAWGLLEARATHAAQIALSKANTEFQQLTISAKSFEAARIGEKELLYQGALFDIKKRVVAGDSILLTVYHDREEEALFRFLGDLLSDGNTDGNGKLSLINWLAECLGTAYVPSATPVLMTPVDRDFGKTVFHLVLPAPQKKPEHFSPPPEPGA